MNWDRAAKIFSALILLAFGLYGAFVTGRWYQAKVITARDSSRIEIYRKNVRNLTNDGRFGTNCRVCIVPFFRLIAFPERYDNKEIRTVGFLKLVLGNNMVLFPTEDSAKTLGFYENVLISADVSDELRRRLKDGVWVEVSGRFDAMEESLFSIGGLFNAGIDEHPSSEQEPEKPPAVTLKIIKPQIVTPPQFETQSDTH